MTWKTLHLLRKRSRMPLDDDEETRVYYCASCQYEITGAGHDCSSCGRCVCRDCYSYLTQECDDCLRWASQDQDFY